MSTLTRACFDICFFDVDMVLTHALTKKILAFGFQCKCLAGSLFLQTHRLCWACMFLYDAALSLRVVFMTRPLSLLVRSRGHGGVLGLCFELDVALGPHFELDMALGPVPWASACLRWFLIIYMTPYKVFEPPRLNVMNFKIHWMQIKAIVFIVDAVSLTGLGLFLDGHTSLSCI